MVKKRVRRLHRAVMGAALVAVVLAGCTHIAIEDCPDGAVLGNNDPGTARLRTSHFRVILADEAAAAARVLPYALMSAYAYRMGDACQDENEVRIDDARKAQLEGWLRTTTGSGPAWERNESFSTRSPKGDPGCEDEEGLMFHVWERELGNRTYVVLAFRGTSGGLGDWWYGNLWWFTRFLTQDNQLSRAAAHAQRVIEAYEARAAAGAKQPPRFVATGHSLGGGLAQHVLYRFPDRVEQAIVFDPSSVTGFAAVGQDRQLAGCTCDPEPLRDRGVTISPEARILRVYQTYEALANLRIFHKIILPPERHVHELRFPFEASWNPVSRHSMFDLAEKLRSASDVQVTAPKGIGWLASRSPACTEKLLAGQAASCQRAVTAGSLVPCPQ